MKTTKIALLKWTGAIALLFIICGFSPFQCENGNTQSTPPCEEYGHANIHFGNIALHFNPELMDPGDKSFFQIYHNIQEGDDTIDDLFDLINTNEYFTLDEKSRSYIDISLTAPECTGAVTQRYSHPDDISINLLRNVKSMKIPPKTISYTIKTGLSWNKNRIGWHVIKDYATLMDLEEEGEFISEDTIAVAQVAIPGIMMKEISIDDPDFPVAPGTGIWIGGDIDFGSEIDMH